MYSTIVQYLYLFVLYAYVRPWVLGYNYKYRYSVQYEYTGNTLMSTEYCIPVQAVPVYTASTRTSIQYEYIRRQVLIYTVALIGVSIRDSVVSIYSYYQHTGIPHTGTGTDIPL